MRLDESTWPEVKARLETGANLKAVLILGSTEQHGHHLPLGTDTMIGMEAWDRVEKVRDDVLLLPPIALGCSEVWRSYPGTLCLRPSTLIALVQDVASSLERHGIGILILQAAHGGNSVVAHSAAKEYAMGGGQTRIFVLDPHVGVPSGICEGRRMGHACEVETSMGLVAFPALVKMDLARAGVVGAWTSPRDMTTDEYRTNALGVNGEPQHASVQKGEAILREMCRWRCEWLDTIQSQTAV
ncbi:MAG: hypothetical protein A3K19_28810 [Lentisphaerae bacterium RIFOXYB12_FULL_65_16]|nr:MAG: hypothetical protein A3K18_01520 [Lentisphaerae bacterium RIFOXYA12_64_32]OGV88280.1 MAG: hypothetical protein A3K19_28810 [Lentisphaerae bacterium RIFOXYB12_FULL_65_16]